MFACGTGGTSRVRRNSSAKLGPGSSADENRGRGIGRGGYRLRRSTQSVPRPHAVSAVGSGRAVAKRGTQPPKPVSETEMPSALRSLAALLHVRLHELLGIDLERLVDLVEEVVELCLDLLAGLGLRRRLFHDLVLLRGTRLL